MFTFAMPTLPINEYRLLFDFKLIISSLIV